MPCFDVVSEVCEHELANSVNQANQELATRYDFRNTEATFAQNKMQVILSAGADFQLQQMLDILRNKLIKRGIDIHCLQINQPYASGKHVKQEVVVQQGIDKALSKRIIQEIKTSKIKVQTAIIGEKIRITGKKRDDLQQVIALLRASELNWPLQYNNFRD